MISLSAVVPAYNEEENVGVMIESMSAISRRLPVE